jgi:hypothetical protein
MVCNCEGLGLGISMQMSGNEQKEGQLTLLLVDFW